jgi:pilus assembly protein Flp/PilA
MNTMLLKLYVKFQDLKNREEGQDLIEYALLAGLIALGATAAITSIGTSVGTIFTKLQTAMTAAA